MTEHLAAYRRVFGDRFELAPGALPSRLLAVLFTNRCGSMLFTEMIGSSPDITTQYEVFNGTVVQQRTEVYGDDSFAGYLARIFGRSGATYTAKIHAVQLEFLARAGLLRAFSGGIRFFRIHRRDQIAQAVSHSIARQTGRWTSFANQDGQARYDYCEIRTILDTIQREQATLDRLTARHNLAVRNVVFEDFLPEPAQVLAPAWRSLNVRPGRCDLAETRHRRQSTTLNREFIRRFRAEMARRGDIAAA